MDHTSGPWEYDRGFKDAANYPGDHYTISDDFITVYMGEEAITDFDPEKHDWAEIHGPNQDANAHLITAAPTRKAENIRLADMLEAATDAVCDMCKQKNPQHADCTSCFETNPWREAIRKARG